MACRATVSETTIATLRESPIAGSNGALQSVREGDRLASAFAAAIIIPSVTRLALVTSRPHNLTDGQPDGNVRSNADLPLPPPLR